jgi:hypothetical protein
MGQHAMTCPLPFGVALLAGFRSPSVTGEPRPTEVSPENKQRPGRAPEEASGLDARFAAAYERLLPDPERSQ